MPNVCVVRKNLSAEGAKLSCAGPSARTTFSRRVPEHQQDSDGLVSTPADTNILIIKQKSRDYYNMPD